MKKISFITGLPRAGSTLLTNILNSNPNHFVTPTSGLIETVMGIKKSWKHNDLYRAEGIGKIKPRILSGMEGFVQGYFANEKGNVAFDKSRGWMAFNPILREVFGEDYKMIVCVRDVKAIVASFEKLHRKNGIESNDWGEDFVLAQSPEGRADIWLRDGNLVGLPIKRLRDAMRTNPDNFIFVSYPELTSQPKEVFERIHTELGLEPFEYDFDNVEQTVIEEDIIHGWKDLHNIRSKVEPNPVPGWHGIYVKEFLEDIDKKFGDINNLATY
jgi:sulfotransferase